jgi:membrane-bound metal-dependent hydrolase YbcI (DUF457 family)
MMARSHLTHGVTIASTTSTVLLLLLPVVPDKVRMGVFWLVVLGSIVPDIDHHDALLTQKLGPIGWALSGVARLVGGGRHRGWTHTPFGAAVFGAITAAAMAYQYGELASWWWAWGLGMFVGCMTHRWGDCRTVGGCPPAGWYPGKPMQPRVVCSGRATFKTGSTREKQLRTEVYRPLAAGSAAFALMADNLVLAAVGAVAVAVAARMGMPLAARRRVSRRRR